MHSGFVTEVHVRNRTTGKEFGWENVINSVADELIVNFDAYMRVTGDPVITGDGADRYSNWLEPREPLALIPGDNELELKVTPSQDVTATVQWLSTWL